MVTVLSSKPGPKRTKDQRLVAREEVGRLYLHGMSMHEIGVQLGVSAQQVHYDLTKMREEWKSRYSGSIQTHKERELIKIDELERTYWAAWERSLEERVETTVTDDDMGHKVTVKTITKEGNPAFLAGAERCVQQRREMLGMDAPKRTALTDTEGNDLLPIDALRALFFRSTGGEALPDPATIDVSAEMVE